MSESLQHVPIYKKAALTIKEAAEYSNIGINKINAMLRAPNCPFVLFVGTKKLVKRKEFEQFISNTLILSKFKKHGNRYKCADSIEKKKPM